MIYRAKHKYADTGARKMRPFASLVRGKNVDEAVSGLKLPDKYKDYNMTNMRADVQRVYDELKR